MLCGNLVTIISTHSPQRILGICFLVSDVVNQDDCGVDTGEITPLGNNLFYLKKSTHFSFLRRKKEQLLFYQSDISRLVSDSFDVSTELTSRCRVVMLRPVFFPPPCGALCPGCEICCDFVVDEHQPAAVFQSSAVCVDRARKSDVSPSSNAVERRRGTAEGKQNEKKERKRKLTKPRTLLDHTLGEIHENINGAIAGRENAQLFTNRFGETTPPVVLLSLNEKQLKPDSA